MTPWIIAIPLFLLAGASGVGAVFFGVVLWRTLRTERSLPTARRGVDLPPPQPEDGGGWPKVCIVVPAHNEQDVIRELASSLMAQNYPSLSIVFALDRCADDTDRIVTEECVKGTKVGAPGHHTEIVRITECPSDWAGKTHAVWRGVCDSKGARDAELLLFADADTIFDPALVRASVALLYQRELDMLSLLSRLTTDQWFERTAQPAAGFELVRQYPLDFVNRRDRPRAFANGQFMLFRREFYDSLGGHERVKSELLEDMAFARLMRKRRKHGHCRWGVLLSGPASMGPRPEDGGMFCCRMYRNWDSFRRGWKRIYMEAARRNPKELLNAAWKHRLLGVIFPAAYILGLAGGAAAWSAGDAALGASVAGAAAGGLAITLFALVRVYRSQGAPIRYVPLFPIGAWIVAGLLSEAAADLRTGTKTMWGGREYAREMKK